MHTYLVYKNIHANELCIIPTTHLYVKDANRFSQLNKVLLKKVKFNNFDVPTGVKNYYYVTDNKGTNINLLDKNIIPIKKV